MKTLHDGTKVSDETPTRLVNGKRYLLTQEEIDQREAEAAANLKPSLREYNSGKRKKLEYGEITVDGLTFHITQESKSDLLALQSLAASNLLPNNEAEFKHNSGVTVIDSARALTITTGAFAHLQNLRKIEAVVLAKIDNGTITTAAEIDSEYEA